MDPSAPHSLIIVEGLTGSGKSVMAHFIARQLGYNGIAADWIHEGAAPHPVTREIETTIEDFQVSALDRWRGFVAQIAASDTVEVVEACLFNLLIESLFAHNLARLDILAFADTLQKVIQPLNPALVYLTQRDVRGALERNFRNRGEGFQRFVIDYATGTPYAKSRGLEGYDGMVAFWQDFVTLTDALFDRYAIDKIKIENSAGEWERYHQKVMTFLSTPLLKDPTLSEQDAQQYVGVYRDKTARAAYPVVYDNGNLLINFFHNAWARLIPHRLGVFCAEGWYFEIQFAQDHTGEVTGLVFCGEDVDYLKLVGTAAEKVAG
jgi:thymidylate kinase